MHSIISRLKECRVYVAAVLTFLVIVVMYTGALVAGFRLPAALHVLLHAVNGLLVCLLLSRTTKTVTLSMICALLFGLQPLRVESVLGQNGVADMLGAFFWLGTFHVYVSYVKKKAVWLYGLSLLLAACAVMVNPVLAALPLVLLLFDLWPLLRWWFWGGDENEPVWKLVAEKIPMLVVSCGVAAFCSAKGNGAAWSPVPDDWWMRIPLNAGYYLYNVLLPGMFGLSSPGAAHISPVMVTVWAGVLITITVLAIHSIKKFPYFTVGWGWFLLGILPVSAMNALGVLGYSDGYAYIASVGIAIAVVWMIFGFLHSTIERRIAACGALVVLLVFAVMTVLRVLSVMNGAG